MGSGTLIGGDAAAHESQLAARASFGEAKKSFKRVNRILRDESKLQEEATVSSMADMDKRIADQEKNLARQEQMISAIDPTIMEASQQALRLLRGESSSVLAPMQKQRDMQRQKLMNSLREQLGPGAETSTAGIQALTRFDAETNSLMAGAQQQALGNLGNLGGQFSQMRPDMLREIGGAGQFSMQKLGARRGMADFQLARTNQLMQAANPLIAGAGARYTAATMRGLEQQKAGFMMANLGGSMLGGMGGGGGKSGSEQVDYTSMDTGYDSSTDWSTGTGTSGANLNFGRK